MSKGYFSQEVSLSSSGISLPEGYENIFLTIFFLVIPYIIGFLFLFFIVSKLDYGTFETIKNNEGSLIVSWLVGYEIVSILTLLVLFLKFFSYDQNQKNTSGRNNYQSANNRLNNNYNSGSKRKKKNVKFPGVK